MQIHWFNAAHFSEEEKRSAEARIVALDRERGDLTDVRIASRTSGHHRSGDCEVRISCLGRRSEIVAARVAAKPRMALADALDVFLRDVRRLRERRGAQMRRRLSQVAT